MIPEKLRGITLSDDEVLTSAACLLKIYSSFNPEIIERIMDSRSVNILNHKFVIHLVDIKPKGSASVSLNNFIDRSERYIITFGIGQPSFEECVESLMK